jgi:hypothetical protein
VFGSLCSDQIFCRFVGNVGCQRKEAGAHDLERDAFDALPAVVLGVQGQSPEQRGAGGDFDEAVHAKADERNAAGE